jgi:hypothetical protein
VFCDAHDVGMKGLYNHHLNLRGVGRIIAAKVLNCEVHTLGQSVPNVPGPFVPSTSYSHHHHHHHGLDGFSFVAGMFFGKLLDRLA